MQKDAFQNIRKNIESREWVLAIKKLVLILKKDKLNAYAQYLLGYIYENGVREGEEDAIKWYTASFGNGNKRAESVNKIVKYYQSCKIEG